MTLYQFRLLSPRAQLLLVLMEGTYLAQRWEEEEGGVNLYHLPDEGRGFFAEVGIDKIHDCFAVLRSFSSSVPLETYAQEVQLPGGGKQKASPETTEAFWIMRINYLIKSPLNNTR